MRYLKYLCFCVLLTLMTFAVFSLAIQHLGKNDLYPLTLEHITLVLVFLGSVIVAKLLMRPFRYLTQENLYVVASSTLGARRVEPLEDALHKRRYKVIHPIREQLETVVAQERPELNLSDQQVNDLLTKIVLNNVPEEEYPKLVRELKENPLEPMEQRCNVRLHEAAHAIVALHLNAPLSCIELIDSLNGYTSFRNFHPDTPENIWKMALITLSGGLAENISNPNNTGFGSVDDYMKVQAYINLLHTIHGQGESTAELWTQATEEVKAIIQTRMLLIQHLAERLPITGFLNEHQILEIIQEYYA